jgi:hypothetical protein
MTPKENAIYLIHLFNRGGYGKINARIHVEEILSINSVDKDEDLSNYWEQVKQEIEKTMTNNKQQTTLQILINGLIDRKKNIIENADSMPNDMLEGGVMAFESAIDLAQSLLEMDKKQIILAITANLPIEDGVLTAVQKAEQYYNETYGGGEQ